MKNTILIIDDDRDFLEATSLLLQANNYEVISAISGKEGFHQAKVASPDLILLDLRMAYDTEGVDIANSISKDAAIKDIPVVLITGLKSDSQINSKVKLNDNKLPVKEVMEKPVQPDNLLQIIKKYTSGKVQKRRKTVTEITKMVDKWRDKQGNLVMILHEIQNNYGYVPRGISFELSRLLGVPLARIYEVLTFYNFFKLTPPGKFNISICMGTACYLKGADKMLDIFKDILGIQEDETTEDGLFHLEVVRCLGCCGLAPALMLNGKIYGNLTEEKIKKIINSYRQKAQEDEIDG
jgi:NADH-quinone oxidoreductase subunit E